MKFCVPLLAAALLAGSGSTSFAAIVGFEAESGSLGSNWTTGASASASGSTYITASTGAFGEFPGTSDRVATYSIDLEAGTYDLYARYLVGPNGVNDDSFLVGNGFGEKDVSTADDWIKANQLGTAESLGQIDADESVILSDGIFNWVNLTADIPGTFSEQVPQFVANTTGIYTFQIATREDGLLIDAFAFAPSASNPSSADLSSEVPEPTGFIVGIALISGILGQRRR